MGDLKYFGVEPFVICLFNVNPPDTTNLLNSKGGTVIAVL